jgi:hypothetical protein
MTNLVDRINELHKRAHTVMMMPTHNHMAIADAFIEAVKLLSKYQTLGIDVICESRKP